jgi:short-subunit dehydrogenase
VVSSHVLDLADASALPGLLPEVLAAHGRVTVLVNNAGIALGGSFLQLAEADFDQLMAVNFGATVKLSRLFLPVMAREPAAQLVNISSIFGIVAPPGQTAYCASKFAVRGFSEALRHELLDAGSSVGLTLVHPGGVRTAIADNARVAQAVSDAERQRQQAAWRVLLRLEPADAAQQIVHAIETRAPRVLVGRDAAQAAWLQRLFPVHYWRHAARNLARRIARA